MRKQKKKIRLKLLPFFILLIVLLIIYLLYLFISNIRLKNIYICGNSIISDQEIIDISGLYKYPKYVSISDKKIEKKIKTNLYIKSVDVKKDLKFRVKINIIERKPLFIYDNKLVLEDNIQLENTNNIIVPTLLNYVYDVKYEEFIKKLLLIESQVYSKISEIKYVPTEQDKDRFAFYMDDGNLVYITLTKISRINYYDDIVKEFSCKKGILNLDSGNHFEVKINNCL